MKDFSHIDIENDKVQKIITAALDVFSNNDYDKASTNKIVQKAEIPRGVLYYYFKNKEELYEFLIYYSQVVSMLEAEKWIDFTDSDFLNRVKNIIKAKINTLKRFPFLTDFSEKISQDSKLKDYDVYVQKSNKFRLRIMQENLDFSQLKDNVDIEMFKKVAYYALGGEVNNIINRQGIDVFLNDNDKLMTLLDEQIEFLRLHFYQ